ncbi:MAG: hypothetical protein GY716_12435 [bacterium]|nr:hypothetical protein [bacterium]
MPPKEMRRRSRWILRAMEWNDGKARYPNLWHEGMPAHVLASGRVAGRLRLGDLIAVYYPASEKHSKRSESFVGISRVAGLRRSHEREMAWVDLETAHRFRPALKLDEQPRRVFLCCDPGWPDEEVRLFEQVFDAAVAAGWKPSDDEARPVDPREPPRPAAEARTEAPAEKQRKENARYFAGVNYSGDMRDPRDGTWLAIAECVEGRLRVTRLEATGRTGLQGYLRDPDHVLTYVEAIGLDFPFGLPVEFSESLMGSPFPDEGWWALARRFEKLSRPDYLVAIDEYRRDHGEPKRLTDERAGASSPLHRVEPDLAPMAYHGIRMIAEDRSRFSLRPFETAQGKLLLEVYPHGAIERLHPGIGDGARRPAIVGALAAVDDLPVEFEGFDQACLRSPSALDAVVAARCAAQAVLSGEAERPADELAPGQGERLRREGWIYGL